MRVLNLKNVVPYLNLINLYCNKYSAYLFIYYNLPHHTPPFLKGGIKLVHKLISIKIVKNLKYVHILFFIKNRFITLCEC
jgi:hypothetical protein